MALAARVNEARKRIRSGQADWEDAVRRAFTDKDNNLTGWRARSRFLEWMERESDTCKGALQALWSTTGPPPPPEERLRGFFEQVPGDVLKSLGERLNIGSFLMMAEDPGRLPPGKDQPIPQSLETGGARWRADKFGAGRGLWRDPSVPGRARWRRCRLAGPLA